MILQVSFHIPCKLLPLHWWCRVVLLCTIPVTSPFNIIDNVGIKSYCRNLFYFCPIHFPTRETTVLMVQHSSLYTIHIISLVKRPYWWGRDTLTLIKYYVQSRRWLAVCVHNSYTLPVIPLNWKIGPSPSQFTAFVPFWHSTPRVVLLLFALFTSPCPNSPVHSRQNSFLFQVHMFCSITPIPWLWKLHFFPHIFC